MTANSITFDLFCYYVPPEITHPIGFYGKDRNSPEQLVLSREQWVELGCPESITVVVKN